jgi:hypothetical protein
MKFGTRVVAFVVRYWEQWACGIVGLTEFSVETLIHDSFHQDFVLLLIHGVFTFAGHSVTARC